MCRRVVHRRQKLFLSLKKDSGMLLLFLNILRACCHPQATGQRTEGCSDPFCLENNPKKNPWPAAIHLHERSLYFRCAHYVSDLSHTFNWWHAFRFEWTPGWPSSGRIRTRQDYHRINNYSIRIVRQFCTWQELLSQQQLVGPLAAKYSRTFSKFIIVSFTLSQNLR
jgi:hypothetical protein